MRYENKREPRMAKPEPPGESVPASILALARTAEITKEAA